VLGLADAPAVRSELEERLGRTVFEVPTVPPSVPGIRLFECLRSALRSAGARLVIGDRVVGAETANGRVEAVVAGTAARRVAYPAASFVLATGGFASGGFELDSYGVAREQVFDLPLAGLAGAGRPTYAPRYFDPQPLERAGLAVNERLRPVDAAGNPVYENLHAAGAALAGAAPWREKSGDGISLATGYAAAACVLETAAAGASAP
jgi:glycerol-3-phosphate dehydrogenase subunit B